MQKVALVDLLRENETLMFSLLKRGVFPPSVLNKKLYYEFFLLERKNFKTVQAVTNTADEFKVSERTIYLAIKLMKS